MKVNLQELGVTGLKRFSGLVYDEWLSNLQGPSGMKVYREMLDNDPVIGAVMFAIKMLCRQASWKVVAASSQREDLEAADFLESCLDDMSISWQDLLGDILSFLGFGWAYHEIVYKKRLGDQRDPRFKSKYNDGRIGWRKIPIRAQDSLLRWEFDEEGGIKAMVQLAPPDYVEKVIPIEKSLLFRTESAKGNPEGRALDPQTPILTTQGWKVMGELELNDFVYDEFGHPKRVVAIARWENRPCFKIITKTDEIIADVNHLWFASRPDERKLRAPWRLLSTEAIAEFLSRPGRELVLPTERFGKDKPETKLEDCPYHKIEAVLPVESRDTVCIQIEGPGHVFVAGKSLIPTHNSIIRNAYRAWYLKKQIEVIEGIGIERDLAGLPVVWVPPNIANPTTEEEIAAATAFKNLITGIRRDQNEGVVMPLAYDDNGNKLYDLTLLSSAGGRTFDTNAIIGRYDQRIAATVMADFVLLGGQRGLSGSFALAANKTRLFSMAISTFLDIIENVFNTYAIPRLFALNDFKLKRLPRLRHGDIDDVDLAALGSFISKLAGAGMELFPNRELERYILEAANLPVKSMTEELLDKQEVQ